MSKLEFRSDKVALWGLIAGLLLSIPSALYFQREAILVGDSGRFFTITAILLGAGAVWIFLYSKRMKSVQLLAGGIHDLNGSLLMRWDQIGAVRESGGVVTVLGMGSKVRIQVGMPLEQAARFIKELFSHSPSWRESLRVHKIFHTWPTIPKVLCAFAALIGVAAMLSFIFSSNTFLVYLAIFSLLALLISLVTAKKIVLEQGGLHIKTLLGNELLSFQQIDGVELSSMPGVRSRLLTVIITRNDGKEPILLRLVREGEAVCYGTLKLLHSELAPLRAATALPTKSDGAEQIIPADAATNRRRG